MDAKSGMDQLQWLALKDRALIYVNEGFERLTGYAAADALGRNCKFLQGADTDPQTIDEIRAALAAQRDCTVEILNYRKDGTPFWNRLSITPVRDDTGTITHYIGIQSDVSMRRRAEDGLREATRKLAQANATLQRELEEAAEHRGLAAHQALAGRGGRGERDHEVAGGTHWLTSWKRTTWK